MILGESINTDKRKSYRKIEFLKTFKQRIIQLLKNIKDVHYNKIFVCKHIDSKILHNFALHLAVHVVFNLKNFDKNFIDSDSLTNRWLCECLYKMIHLSPLTSGLILNKLSTKTLKHKPLKY